MAPRDYKSTPVSDSLGLEGVITGLANDLMDMRSGKISPQEGIARAAVAKQLFNGVRMYLQAMKTMESLAADVTDRQALTTTKDTDQ